MTEHLAKQGGIHGNQFSRDRLLSIQRFRPIFAVIVGVVWFVLLLGFGLLIALQLPGDEPLPLRLAWRFFLVGFFAICLFAPPATFIGFLQQYFHGGVSSAPGLHVSDRLRSTARSLVFGGWPVCVLLAPGGPSGHAWFVAWCFQRGIGRGAIAFMLALLGAPLGSPGMALLPAARRFSARFSAHHGSGLRQDSFLSYLVWRHGAPWGVDNGVINAVIALALFPAPWMARMGDAVHGCERRYLLTALVLWVCMALVHSHSR